MAGSKDNCMSGELIVIGRVLRPYGTKGDVIVQPLTFDPDRFLDIDEVALDFGSGALWQTISHVRAKGNNLIVKFAHINSADEAAPLRGSYIKIDKGRSPTLPEGVYYYYQLEGLSVFDDKGLYLGKVQSIMQTGGSDVYVVNDNEGGEYLIPAIKDVILSIDLHSKKMIVRLLEMV